MLLTVLTYLGLVTLSVLALLMAIGWFIEQLRTIRFRRFDRHASEQIRLARWFASDDQHDVALSCYELAEWYVRFRDDEYRSMLPLNRSRWVHVETVNGSVVSLSGIEKERRNLVGPVSR